MSPKALLVGLLVLGSTLPGMAAEQTLEVFADRMELNLDTKTTEFRKNVRMTFDQYQARCQQAVVYVDPHTRKLQKVIMSGSVMIEKDGSVFKGQKVIYDAQNRRLIVEGQVYGRLKTDGQQFKAEFK